MKAIVVVLVAVTMSTSVPAVAQSNKNTCREILAGISALAENYRLVTDQTNALPMGSMVNTLQGTEQEKAEALAEAHDALRPLLNDYVDRLEDMTYAMRVCLR